MKGFKTMADNQDNLDNLDEDNVDNDNPSIDENGSLDEGDDVEIEEKGDEDKVEVFMSEKDVPAEMKPAWRKMQGSFTRAMQSLSGDRDKVALAEKLLEDPENAISILSKASGVEIKSEEKANENDSNTETEKWVKDIALQAIKPLLDSMGTEMASVKVKIAERYLDDAHPDWYLYENQMAELLKVHPTLGTDLDKLYTIAKGVSDEADGLQRQSDKTSKVSTKASAGRGESKTIGKAKNLDEAVAMAAKAHGIDLNNL